MPVLLSYDYRSRTYYMTVMSFLQIRIICIIVDYLRVKRRGPLQLTVISTFLLDVVSLVSPSWSRFHIQKTVYFVQVNIILLLLVYSSVPDIKLHTITIQLCARVLRSDIQRIWVRTNILLHSQLQLYSLTSNDVNQTNEGRTPRIHTKSIRYIVYVQTI